ncbi:MAG: nucleoside triphosphate pyrophosphohydrolase [Rickettsiales bacterium]|nr:nucleoside triphosphate pyrophosphohydrolase [Rickettsiales bacterium]
MKKLVRDKIPEIFHNTNIKILTNDNDFYNSLKDKLFEEIKEFYEASNEDELVSEMGDVFEVLHAICDFKKISLEEIEKKRIKKLEERGGFKKRIMLTFIKD